MIIKTTNAAQLHTCGHSLEREREKLNENVCQGRTAESKNEKKKVRHEIHFYFFTLHFSKENEPNI